MAAQGRVGREIHRATADGGASERVLYSFPAPKSYENILCLQALCLCDLFACAHLEETRKSTYVNIYENKIEYNRPFLCCCQRIDSISVLYFDRDVVRRGKIGKADCCSPCCTHCSICPTCCDACGEGSILYSPPKCPCGLSICCECLCDRHDVLLAPNGPAGTTNACCISSSWLMLYPLVSSSDFNTAFMEVREKCKQQMGGSISPTAPQTMSRGGDKMAGYQG